MAEIKVKVEGQLLTVQNQEVIASGDVDYDTCAFGFDGAWEGFAKTAVFYQDKTKVQYAVLGSDGTCLIPAAAMAGEGNMYLGVFGISGPKVITSTVERVYIRQGAVSGDTVSAEPGDDIFLSIIVRYQQVMEQMQAYDIKMDEFIGILNRLNAFDVADVMGRLEAAEGQLDDMDVVIGNAVENGIAEVSGGLRFAQDVNGNWGYVVPGSEDVVPFGKTGGTGDGIVDTLKRYPWEFVDGNEDFILDGHTWKGTLKYPENNESGKKYLFLAVDTPQACKAVATSYTEGYGKYTLFLNDVLEHTNTNTSVTGSTKHFLNLKKGINYLLLECYVSNVGNPSTVKIQLFLPPVVS